MERFNVEGSYVHVMAPSGRGEFYGEMEVSDKGSFEGEVYDCVSIAPAQTIRTLF